MPVVTRPPGQRTGYAHPGCYARALQDCDQKLSREHFISNKLLERMKPLTIEGASWAVERRPTTPKALASKILCARHNQALSGLDDKITDFYDALMQWHRGKHAGDVTIDGEDLERWAIKALFGYMTSGVARTSSGERLIARSVPDDYVRVLFGEADLEERCGLYLMDHWAPEGARYPGVSLTVIRADGGEYTGRVAGVAASIADIPFAVTVAEVSSLQCYRPREIHLVGSGKLTLTWPASHRGGGVFFLERDRPRP